MYYTHMICYNHVIDLHPNVWAYSSVEQVDARIFHPCLRLIIHGHQIYLQPMADQRHHRLLISDPDRSLCRRPCPVRLCVMDVGKFIFLCHFINQCHLHLDRSLSRAASSSLSRRICHRITSLLSPIFLATRVPLDYRGSAPLKPYIDPLTS